MSGIAFYKYIKALLKQSATLTSVFMYFILDQPIILEIKNKKQNVKQSLILYPFILESVVFSPNTNI